MVGHLLHYRLKCFFKDRPMLFWTLVFPLLLATLFNLAFANLNEIESFIQIPVAVVDNAAFRQNEALQSALELVSTPDSDSANPAGHGLFQLTLTDEASARQLLDDASVDGVILADPEVRLWVKRTGLNQTIIKSFLDDFNQTSQAILEITAANPTALQTGLLDVLMDRRDFIQPLPISKDQLNSTVLYFYSLIAMTALYGGFWGMRIASENQANLSAQGARVSVAPVHKLLRLAVDIGAALVIQYAIILVVIAYIQLVLGYSFGPQLGYVFLAALVASFVGVAYGACIAAIIKTKEGIKTGILILSTMVMSFLSGMMYHGIKYLVTQAVPLLAWINPANLITDAYLALYYDGASSRYFLNLAILMTFGLLCSLLAFLVLRRQRYASL